MTKQLIKKIQMNKHGKINLNIPWTPNFDDKPAKSGGVEVLASRWTSGDQ
jgi:hypothetical protein